MTDRTLAGGLQVATSLHAFLAQEALPAAGIDPAGFWDGVARIIEDLTPVNRALLARRDELQAAIDDWHRAHAGQPLDIAGYRAFLTGIGYLADDPGPFQVAPLNVDLEISSLAGPQLVVPVNNARFAINAANARWGSLYDALYGTDVIAEDFGATRHGSYNPVRGERVIGTVRDFLDEAVPLAGASHRDVISYAVSDGSLVAQTAAGYATLADPAAFAGLRRLSGRAVRRTAAPPRPAPGDTHRPGGRDRLRRSGRRSGRPGRGRAHHDHRLRGLGRRGRCGRQGRRLPQLAGPVHRRAQRASGEGRHVVHPPPGARSRVHQRGRQRAHPAGPVPAAGAQCRPPDDHRRGLGRRRRGDLRGHPGRHRHDGRRAARAGRQC